MSSFHDELVQQLHHDLRWRRRLCCVLTFGRHRYGERQGVEVRSLDGLTDQELVDDVGFVEIGGFVQCSICYDTQECPS